MNIIVETCQGADINPEATARVRFVGLTLAMIECMKEMGLDRGQAIAVAPTVIAAAWECPRR